MNFPSIQPNQNNIKKQQNRHKTKKKKKEISSNFNKVVDNDEYIKIYKNKVFSTSTKLITILCYTII